MGKTGPSYFRIPLTFPSISFLTEGQNVNQEVMGITECSLAKSKPTVLEFWGLGTHGENDGEQHGVILGCQDGSVYVVHQLPDSCSTTVDPQFNETKDPKTTIRPLKSSQSKSRSESPTIPPHLLSPTFIVTARPRAVSGITAEQIEAPKNYVDFNDEPDKLKDILKGRNPKDRHSYSDSNSDKTPRSASPSAMENLSNLRRKNATPKSLLSATNSRAPTPSFSAPGSPKDIAPLDSTSHWDLRYHIIPSHSGSRHAVKSIQLLNDARFFAVLQEAGDLYIYLSEDGSCLASLHVADELNLNHPAKVKERQKPRDVWSWSNLTLLPLCESVLLVATAANDNDTSALTPDADEGSETSRCVLVEFMEIPSGIQLRKLGQWDLEGPADGVGIFQEDDGVLTFFCTSHDGHFITRRCIPKPIPFHPVPHVENGINHQHTPHLPSLPLPNPFKSMMSHPVDQSPPSNGAGEVVNDNSTASLSKPVDLGVLLENTAFSGLKTLHSNKGLFGVAWTRHSVVVFEYSKGLLKVTCVATAVGVEDAQWLDHDRFVLAFEDRVDEYRIYNIDPYEDFVHHNGSDSLATFRSQVVRSIPVGNHDSIKLNPNYILMAKFSSELQAQQIVAYTISDPLRRHVLWQSISMKSGSNGIVLTSTLPLELEMIIHGYSDGNLRRYSLAQMARKLDKSTSVSSSLKSSDVSLSGYLVGLHVVQNPRTKEKYIVGGADDGSIAFWSLNTFELVARWTVFISPLSKVLQCDAEKSGGCALCVSGDGTVAVIVIDGFHLRYLLPGSVASLKKICFSGTNLLLIYGNQSARLWDSQTKELWRSMAEDKAQELLNHEGWTVLALESDACVPTTPWTPVAESFIGQDAAASLLLNFEKVIVDSISVTKTISTSKDEIREILLSLDRLRLLLSALLTPGLNSDVDSICYGKLGAYPSSALVGLVSDESTTLFPARRSQDIWSISSNVSAARALAIIAVLRAMSLFEELTDGANTVISFYTSSVRACAGPQFKPPSLEFLGRIWFQASNELRQPIRILFDATISSMSDEESIKLAEKWQHYVPSLQPDAERETLNSALALFICGSVATEKYSLLSITALEDISKSISLYLHDEKSIYRVLAIDLCSRGFNVWQHYIDAMEILRSLFDLATNVRKDHISIQNVGSQARMAVLSIATNNMPLLMGTLCIDILSPPSVEHRRSVLQILAFLIKKRPFVLMSHLPRLMEAVVKSLDPNSTSGRDIVLDTATEIIGYVVKTFPTVDFHMATQRLAVGTNEGAVVMYDVKTAIRLYVLEGQKKQITACSFSPDGRRLVTISLKESNVLVWKVGSSFVSFFHPGAPPRQGHGGSQPFKTLKFNIGSEADMSASETLDLVRVEWITDRSVKVKIKQSTMTFST